MQTIGLHIGAGIDAMVSEPTPIHDDLEDRKWAADLRSDLLAEIEKRTPPAKPSVARRVAAFFGLADD